MKIYKYTSIEAKNVFCGFLLFACLLQDLRENLCIALLLSNGSIYTKFLIGFFVDLGHTPNIFLRERGLYAFRFSSGEEHATPFLSVNIGDGGGFLSKKFEYFVIGTFCLFISLFPSFSYFI